LIVYDDVKYTCLNIVLVLFWSVIVNTMKYVP